MSLIEIYTKRWCPYCKAAKSLLDEKQVTYEELHVEDDPTLFEEMTSRAARFTVPQIFIGDIHVGGADDLFAAERSGTLDELLNAADTLVDAPIAQSAF